MSVMRLRRMVSGRQQRQGIVHTHCDPVPKDRRQNALTTERHTAEVFLLLSCHANHRSQVKTTSLRGTNRLASGIHRTERKGGEARSSQLTGGAGDQLP